MAAAGWASLRPTSTSKAPPPSRLNVSKQFRRSSVSSMGVNIRSLSSPLLYNYQYDQLNRLVRMDAWKRTAGAGVDGPEWEYGGAVESDLL
jgi:hypothetical protein